MKNNIWYALDFETTSTNKYCCKVVGLGVCEFNIETGDVRSSYFYADPFTAWDSTRPCVMHNASFDLYLNQRAEAKIKAPVHDTYLMAKHVNNLLPAYDLKSLAWLFFGEPYLELLELKKWFRANKLSDDENYMDMSLPPKELVEVYCLKDVEMTAKLAHVFWKDLKDSYVYDLDRKTILRTLRTEARGLAADLDFYREYKRKGGRRVKYNRNMAKNRMGTEKNPMGDALRDHLASLGEDRVTPTNKTKADAVILRDWRKRDKAISSVARVRDVTHNISHFVNHILAVSVPLPWEIVNSFPGKEKPHTIIGRSDQLHMDIGIFHPNFIQSGAVTRRYRCAGFYGTNNVKTKGNTQNFPPVMRQGIIARPGYEFWKLDLSSIEARMFSSFMETLLGEDEFAKRYRKDPFFNPYLYVIEKCTGHGKVTKKHELYTPYKHGVLGRLYCSGAKRFAKQLREKFELNYTIQDCQNIYSSIDANFPFIKKFQRYLLAMADQQGYLLDPFGAIYYRPSQKPYEIIAHLHQGAAGNVLKWWWNEIADSMERADDHVVNTVHDEFDCEIKKGNKPRQRAQGYCHTLKRLDLFGLPIRAEATKGKNWEACG